MISAPLWIVFIGSITAGGAIDDALARKPAWYVASGVLVGVLCALFVAVRFDLLRYGGSGLMMLGLAIASGAWLIFEVTHNVRPLLRERTRQSMVALAATVALGLLCFPALVLGAVHGWGLL
jgi:hypothetical protein